MSYPRINGKQVFHLRMRRDDFSDDRHKNRLVEMRLYETSGLT